jgi:hypothetical protein
MLLLFLAFIIFGGGFGYSRMSGAPLPLNMNLIFLILIFFLIFGGGYGWYHGYRY